MNTGQEPEKGGCSTIGSPLSWPEGVGSVDDGYERGIDESAMLD